MPGLTKLVDLDLSKKGTEVSVVDDGANDKNRFPISKARDGMPEDANNGIDGDLQEIIKSVLETPIDAEAQLATAFDDLEPVEKQKLTDKGKAAIRGAMRALNAAKEEMPADLMSRLGKMLGMPVAKAGNDHPAPTPVQKDKPGIEGLDEKGQAQLSEVLKSRDDKIIALQTEVRKERDARETRDLIEKAKEKFPGISSPEVLGPVLKRLGDAAVAAEDSALVEDIGTILGASSELVEKSRVLEEVGRGTTANSINGADWEAIEKAAAGYVEKSGGAKLTSEQAVSAYLDTDEGAAAYDRYLEANPSQTS